MHIEGKTVLVTGANRGIGRALLDEALARGARRVYAATRQPFTPTDDRVSTVILDVTERAHVRAAVDAVGSLDVLINNAGLALYVELADRAALERQLDVNLFGPYDLSQAFLPALVRSQGSIINVLSISALASVPFSPAYAISKAAAFSLSQSLRTLLAEQGVSVHSVLCGPVDTDMSRHLEIPKASASSVATAIFEGVERGEEEIFPDPMTAPVAEAWYGGIGKVLERQFAAFA
jgi:NAD(P)-dependent dehydrogenase (short-subunit alcohol dehydrogenase family)